MKPEAGDILLYTVNSQSALSSRLIAFGELIKKAIAILFRRPVALAGKEYSHTALWECDGHQLEATWPKIRRSRIDTNRSFEVYRYKAITHGERTAIVRWAYSQLNKWYDMVYILSFGLIKVSGTEVCCLFVGDAYQAAGLHLKYATPDELLENGRLELVTSFTPSR